LSGLCQFIRLLPKRFRLGAKPDQFSGMDRRIRRGASRPRQHIGETLMFLRQARQLGILLLEPFLSLAELRLSVVSNDQ
jgi:hypothetical protein